MDNSTKFSILVPVYNVEKYIDECIQSVLNQSYQNFELILVDDGSPDSSGKICDSYAEKDARLRVFHKENGGLISARRFGIEHACGDYYVFLDSDDYLSVNSLEILENHITTSGADCIIFGFTRMNPGHNEIILPINNISNRLITNKVEALSIILNDVSYNALWRKCTKASCFGHRDFTPYFHIKMGEDRLQSEEILEYANSFLFIRECLYNYRINEVSITQTIKYDNYKADFTVEESSVALVKRLGIFSDEDFNRFRNCMLDYIVIDLKKLCRYCSCKKISIEKMNLLRQTDYYRSFLCQGYEKTVPSSIVLESSGLRRKLNQLILLLFKYKLYSPMIFINKYIFKSRSQNNYSWKSQM